MFTIVEVYGSHVVRAMENRPQGWVVVSDELVTPEDRCHVAHAIWQLIAELTE